jgi:preprotein translocase subunit SecD
VRRGALLACLAFLFVGATARCDDAPSEPTPAPSPAVEIRFQPTSDADAGTLDATVDGVSDRVSAIMPGATAFIASREIVVELPREPTMSEREVIIRSVTNEQSLHMREVLETLAPELGADRPKLTCPTVASCADRDLNDVDVVYASASHDGTRYRLGSVEFSGLEIAEARAVQSPQRDWQIDYRLTDAGSERFARVTTELMGRQLAVIVDHQVVAAPSIEAPITGGIGVLTGSFTELEAKALAADMESRPLPLELSISPNDSPSDLSTGGG